MCPICRGPLTDVEMGLECPTDRLVYPVVDGVPWLIEERAIAS
ncbi:MAG: Trm112 family protein [Myxococcota bacterium]